MEYSGRRVWAGIVGSAVLALALTGCDVSNIPTATPSPTSTQSTSTPTPTATPLRLDKSGTAQQNLAYFNSVNEAVLAAKPSAVGQDFINALVAAGFNKADMQLTADRTTINLPAGSIQFSVRFNGECLVGQNGSGSGGYTSQVTGMLATGNCLIGQTVPIN